MQPVYEEKHTNKAVVVVLSVVAGILVVIGILTMLALNDPNRGVAAAKADTGKFLAKLGVAALSKQPAEFSQDEVNGLLAARLPSHPVRCSIDPDNTVTVYAPVNYKGIRLGVTANVLPDYDTGSQQLLLKVKSVHVGLLPVPPSFALQLGRAFLPPDAAVQGDTARVGSSLLFGRDLDSSAGIEVTGFEVKDGKAIVSASANSDKFREFIVQSLPNLLSLFK